MAACGTLQYVLVSENLQSDTVEVENGSQIPGKSVSPTVFYMAKGTKFF